MANLKHIKYTTEAKYGAGTKSDDTLYAVPMPKTTAGDIDSGNATSGQVLTANGTGGASWQTAGGGGGSLNAYTFNFTPSSANYTRLINIIANAKGRIYIPLLSNNILYFSGRVGTYISFNTKFYEMNVCEEYQMALSAYSKELFVFSTEVSGSSVAVSMEDVSASIEGSPIPITYFNDSEITQ